MYFVAFADGEMEVQSNLEEQSLRLRDGIHLVTGGGENYLINY